MASKVGKGNAQLQPLQNVRRCTQGFRCGRQSMRHCTIGCWNGNTKEMLPKREFGLTPALKSSLRAECPTEGPVLVWFKNDLRTGDHPGLYKAVEDGLNVVPVYCLDPTVVTGLLDVPGGVHLLWGALCNLERSLKNLGSGVILRIGSASCEILDVAELLGASKIITEDSFDYRWQSAIADVAEKVPIEKWRTSIWEDGEFSDNFREFQSNRGTASQPLECITSLPALNSKFDTQNIPSVEEIKELLENARPGLSTSQGMDPFGKVDSQPWVEWMTQLTSSPHAALSCLRDYLSLERTSITSENAVLNNLVKEFEVEALPGLSFPALFFPAISVGLLSLREVYAEAQNFTQDSGSFWRKIVGLESYDYPTQAAIAESDAADFHRNLAQAGNPLSSTNGSSEQCSTQFWDWQGLAVEFTVSYPDTINDNTPAILLVHGFGASSFHWRRNMEDLRAAGNLVYCVTLPGFGKSQKPCLKYSQNVWRNCIKDFILTVIKKPVTIAGNSIGGYCAASVAGFHKEVINGVVLLNSAGPIVPDFTPDKEDMSKENGNLPPKFAIDIFSNLLLFYLEKSARSTLKKLYPTNPENADEELVMDLLRAGGDPNASTVLKSVAFLPKAIPLNYLLREMYGGPILVVQGCLDPLNDAKGRAAQIEEICPDALVKLLSAGHCPHDEAPKDVNNEIVRFVSSLQTPDPELLSPEMAAL